ncbi:hypothetical protein INS49_004464 [Diaporthe citri]|uniref:uncharacterized protein n=1 Tax=Diaporthe citri TaxID=83186 RepID=UPI001C812663|nr:uncharacterized protein INS49_004464 [Diaporthe citri]KAG6354447.1 hypothetical protein INS49_004464 [Diaporthe citri]
MHEFTSLALCTLSVNWTLTFLAFLAVLAICWSRFSFLVIITRPDDILVLVAFLISTVLVSLSTWAIVDEGQGKHQQDVSASNLETAAKSLLVSEALWTLVTGMLRIAASLLMRSLTKGTHDRVVHHSAIGIMVLSTALATASIIQIFLICQPFAAQWDPQVLGTCGDQVTSFLVIETAGLLLDIAIFTLPPVIVMRLMTPTKMKVQLVLVFNIGAVSTERTFLLLSVLVITGLRMAALRNAVSPDFTYSQSYLSLLSSAGCMTGVICCASPAIRAMFQRVRQNKAMTWRPNIDLEVHVSGPNFLNTRGTRTERREEGRSDRDLEKGSDSGADADGDDQRSSRDAVSESKKTFAPLSEEVNAVAVALVDSGRVGDNELPLDQGQLFWIHQKHGQGWLLAQNPRTYEIGLVPENFVQLRGTVPWGWDKQIEMSKYLQTYLQRRAEPGPR